MPYFAFGVNCSTEWMPAIHLNLVLVTAAKIHVTLQEIRSQVQRNISRRYTEDNC